MSSSPFPRAALVVFLLSVATLVSAATIPRELALLPESDLAVVCGLQLTRLAGGLAKGAKPGDTETLDDLQLTFELRQVWVDKVPASIEAGRIDHWANALQAQPEEIGQEQATYCGVAAGGQLKRMPLATRRALQARARQELPKVLPWFHPSGK